MTRPPNKAQNMLMLLAGVVWWLMTLTRWDHHDSALAACRT